MQHDPTVELNIAKLISWVGYETPTRDGTAINRLADIIEREATQAGAAVRRWPGSPDCGDVLLLTSSRHSTGASILLHGHIGTVHAHGSLTGTLAPRVEMGGSTVRVSTT